MGNMKLCCLMLCLLSAFLGGATAAECGRQAGGALCPNGLCCNQTGSCGDSFIDCLESCQSQCKPIPTIGDSASHMDPNLQDMIIDISRSTFRELLKHRNDASCPGRGFYTYDAFIASARSFPGFGTTGNDTTRRREIAAFLAQTSHETAGGWPTAPDGPYAWGYCFINESNQSIYGQARRALKLELPNFEEEVSRNVKAHFMIVMRFWMTAQANKPSSHDVITGRWTPSSADTSAGRVPGYGLITNIINGELECGHGQDPRVESRSGFYRRYSQIMGVSPGDNLDCNTQSPFP